MKKILSIVLALMLLLASATAFAVEPAGTTGSRGMEDCGNGYGASMGIGASIFLIALGLILALAIDVDLSGIDLQTIGWILTLVGIGGLVLTLTVWNRRRTVVREEPVDRTTHVVREAPVVREERVIRDDRPGY